MIKKFEDYQTSNWQDIEDALDVYQLMELLEFTYGKDKFQELHDEIYATEEDYNPDEYYEQIKWRLEELNLLEDFVSNFDQYQITQQENDPFHWRYRNKHYGDLGKNWN